jgi:hypothetical protein
VYQGDYLAASTVVFNFNTASFADGSPVTLGGTPALSVYKNSTTESTAGVTLTVDYDSRTGMHHVAIDTSADGTFYAAGNDFDVIVTTGTVGGTSVVGRKVGSFSLENRCQKADVRKLLGTAWLTPAVAGTPDVNAKQLGGTAQTGRDVGASVLLSSGIGAGQLNFTSGVVQADAAKVNGVATSSVTTVNANLGTTQPVNFTGTAASALAKVDVIDWASGAVPTPNVTGVPISDLKYILGTAVTQGGAGRLAGSFSALHDVASPVFTTASVNQTGDNYARLGTPAGASVSADIAAVKTDTGNLVSRITSTLFSGITSLAQWLGLLAGKQSGNATARTEVRATGAGSGTFDETTDSLEAVRDNMGTAQTGDSYAIVNNGTFGNSALNTDLDTLLARLTATRAGYLDNLSAGAVALASGVTVTTNNDKTGYALTSAYDFAKGTVAMTESYNADGAAPTPVQCLFVTMQMLTEMSISGTTMTVKKLDGSTTALTLTLNDATTPTSVTRAT